MKNDFLGTLIPGQVLYSYTCGSAFSEETPLLCGPMGSQGPEVVHPVGIRWCRWQSLTP